MNFYPFENDRFIGTLIEVGPTYAKANLPRAAAADGRWQHGNKMGAGIVGEFVVVDCGEMAVLGRITNVKLPEKERLMVEPTLAKNQEAHPIGSVQLLATISLNDHKVISGIPSYPRLGSRVYSAHPTLLKCLAEQSGGKQAKDGLSSQQIGIELAHLPNSFDAFVTFSPERLFGRHCAILGATGGGKSWTVARLIEQTAKHNSRVILLDATGEFRTMSANCKHVYIGNRLDADRGQEEVVMPYTSLTEMDLISIFRPSIGTQGPKLRAAMKSLKLAKKQPTLAPDGIVKKPSRSRAEFEQAYRKYASEIEAPYADFDITKLPRQIDEECVFPTDKNDPNKWGIAATTEQAHCVTLISRIEDILASPALGSIFRTDGKRSLVEVIKDFLAEGPERVLCISLKYLSFEHHAREIVTNAIGRHLLGEARGGSFKRQPVLVFLDEAHQFLSKFIGDEFSRHNLDAFDLIAKEGRKFCLNLCLATQRPRDIPEGVLSQVGTMIVHRLINDQDREVVERACGDIDKSAASFLPTLSPGEAIVVGVDFPIPLTIQISKPDNKPDSSGPNFQKWWQTAPEAPPTPRPVPRMPPPRRTRPAE